MQSATGRGKHRKYAAKAFTEQGVYMLATILKSPIAAQVTVGIMRAIQALSALIQESQTEETKRIGFL
jgi:hypothetical protein